MTDKKFPGNPTKSYRTREPLRITGEITDWQGHSPEALQAMKDGLKRLKELGIEAIEVEAGHFSASCRHINPAVALSSQSRFLV